MKSLKKNLSASWFILFSLVFFTVMSCNKNYSGNFPGKAYHWAAAANDALAQETRYLFDTASSSTNLTVKQQRLDKINALEKSLEGAYATEVDAATLQRSISFGKDVASRVSFWADND